MTPRTPPGQTREKIYQFVRQRLLEGFPPTVREIQHHFGFSAVQTVQEHLRRLVSEGRLVKQKGKARGYALPQSEAPVPTPPTLLVPLLGRVQAGGLDTAVEDCEGYIPVQAGPGMGSSIPRLARAGDAAPHGVAGDSGHAGGPARDGSSLVPSKSAATGDATMKPASVPVDHLSAGGDAHLRATPPSLNTTGQLFALRIHGESMTGAGIMPGDIVIVRSQPTANTGDIVVALSGDEATVKRLRIGRGRIELHPENPEYEPLIFAPDECVILGKVIEVRRFVEPLIM